MKPNHKALLIFIAIVSSFTTTLILLKDDVQSQEPVANTQTQPAIATEQDFCEGIAFISCNTSNTNGVVIDAMPGSIQELITHITVNVPDRIALRIAKCESSFNPKAQNPTSTAYGLYQFTKTTWHNYCEGDITKAEDQIACFDQLYPVHPTWWECN